MSVVVGACALMAAWMVWICMLTALSTDSSRRLNSSKQPQAPHWGREWEA